MQRPRTVFGVDFSGAKKAGRTAWVATCDTTDGDKLQLRDVVPLEKVVGAADRGPALAGLVQEVVASDDALWAMDFPFSLPLGLGLGEWAEQLRFVRDWPGDAPAFGTYCYETLADKKHIRRQTDLDTKTPFDCYHYRIIYQTFYGMRDVAAPLAADAETAVLPFQPEQVAAARRVVVEACPGSTLKRLGLPHQKYKQPGGGSLTVERRRTRRTIFEGLAEHVEMPSDLKTRCRRDPGGDAIDAVLAAVGGWHGYRTIDDDPHYAREGRVYA